MENMWMVRAGENAFLIDDFKDLNIVAIGWGIGDLSGISLDGIKQRVHDKWGGNNLSVAKQASQIYKFVNEFKIGDYVLSYDQLKNKYLIGKITSDYYYSDTPVDKSDDGTFRNIRDVKWLGEVSKDSLNNKTKKNLKAMGTIFSINEDAQKNILNVFNQTKEGKYNKESDIGGDSIPSQRIWLLPIGSSEIANDAWELFKKESYFGIDYTFGNNDVDYSAFNSLHEIKEFMGENISSNSYFPSTVWKFVNSFKKGDYIVIRKGQNKLAGIGIITGDFIPQTKNESKNEFNMNNIRSVNWILTPDDLDMGRRFFSPVPLVELSKYSYLWNVLLCAISRTDDELKQRILNFLFSSFYNDYINAPEGKNHLEKYGDESKLINESWEEISKNYSRDKSVAQAIWDKILDRPIKVQRDGAGNVKSSLKGLLKYNDEEMDNIAFEFFEVVDKLNDTNDINKQKEILEEYSNNKFSKGIKTNRLTSVLNYLNPSYYVINKKADYTYKILYRMFGEEDSLDSELNNYIDNNVKYKKLIKQIGEFYQDANMDVTDFRTFDMFTHWMTDKNLGHFAAENQYSDREVEKLPASLLSRTPIISPAVKYSPLNITPELLESKLQGFAISEDIVNRLCASLNAGKHIIINGTPGTGKTELAVRFSKVSSENNFIDGFVLTTATSDWSTFDTIGGLMPNDSGSLEFRQGKFLEAIQKNKWLIIDEINRADIDKAFGQLFTVLSGQDVELPYKQNDKSIKIKNWDENFCKYDGETATYYIGENWRIIGTMNVDDKDSLFDLSYAFMRRFMFIEVDLPSEEDYKKIIEMWANDLNEKYLRKLIEIYGIVKYRKLGPAIFKDIISYIKERDKLGSPDYNQVLGEAIDSYILPQLEGLNRKTIKEIKEFFEEIGLFDYISDKFNDLTLEL